MHISAIFLHAYSQAAPVTGHVDVKVDESTIQVKFTEDECAQIQAIAVRAWERKQRAIADAVLASTPAVLALPPSESIVEADYTEIF